MPNGVTRLDRVQIATFDVDALARRWVELFDAERAGRDNVECLGAERVVVRLPESDVELLQPSGAGPVRDFVERWSEGLFAVGFSAVDPRLVRDVLERARVPVHVEREQLFAGPSTPGGLRLVVSAQDEAAPVRAPQALLRHIYEVTNPVADEPSATAFYAQALGLDSSRFQPIASRLYGYTGTLTLLDPPQSLDRIEVTQTYGDGAMHRFFERRGEGLYMCFAETDRFDALRERLDAAGARYALRDPRDLGGQPNVLFVHPKSLGGVLLGVSATGVAWEWSSGLRPGMH